MFYLLLSQRDLTLTCQGSWIQLWTVTSLLSSMSKVVGWCLLRKIAKQGSSLYLCIFENAFEKAKETLHGKPYFLFSDVLKRWSFQKNWAGIWSSLYYRERWYLLFRKIWSYTLDGKWKMIFLKKYKEIWYFLQTLKRWSFQKGPRRHMIFLVLSGKMVFFSRKHDLFSLGRKWKTVLLRKYMETWCIAQRRKTGDLIYRVEVWPLLKFIRLEIFYNE